MWQNRGNSSYEATGTNSGIRGLQSRRLHGPGAKGALNLGYKAMDHRNYDEALRKFSQAEKYHEVTPALEAEIMFQRGRCYEALGEWGDAIGAYRFLVEKHAGTS